MIIQIIKLKSGLTEEELLKIARERQPRFQALPGLIQKYYVKLDQPGHYSGIYVWDSMESLSAFRESELAATIPAAYKVVGKPDIEVMETFIQLRD